MTSATFSIKKLIIKKKHNTVNKTLNMRCLLWICVSYCKLCESVYNDEENEIKNGVVEETRNVLQDPPHFDNFAVFYNLQVFNIALNYPPSLKSNVFRRLHSESLNFAPKMALVSLRLRIETYSGTLGNLDN